MKEENNSASKNKWSRIFRKKWFFPAVYLTIAALLLSVVVWYQNTNNQDPDAQNDSEMADDFESSEFDEDAEAVLDQQEVIGMPVENQDQAEIVTKFYDYNAEQKEQEDGLVLYNNRYYQSTGIDIAAADDETFDVVASLSGTVTEVKEDPLLGNVVVLDHGDDVVTYYASLGEVDVKADSEVEQGDKLGTAGKNLFGKDNGTHVHFELRKNDIEVNPEEYFNQPVSKLDGIKAEEVKEDAKEEEDESATEKEDAEATEEDANAVEEDTDSTEEQDGEDSEDIEVDPEQDELDNEGNEEQDEEVVDEQKNEKQEDEQDVEDKEQTDETTDSSASSASA
ncbi:M23 family metallopeptidase [Virgibacillus alimentarius]|uniref:M23 family metallopeptidase n=1 Tax=Virgibacillus alimentarius TaxID=698769 RepID=UPI000A0226D2|nr:MULTISPECIES: M23 family metallopeptidase [Virgibacillus]HLR67734.1 M23 family metallopeptidase [Virgibacillus sp.]